jgi:uncharacterized membrane protein YdjX (TVP38/TMEM64 family)
MTKVKIIITIIFILSFIMLQVLYWLSPISLTYIIEFHDQLLDLIKHYELLSAGTYILIFATSIIFGIPISITIIGGYFFGILPGIIYSLISIFLGALILISFTRFVWRDWLEKRYSDKLKVFNKELKKYGLSYIILVHTTPFMSSFPLNVALGISNLPLYKVMLLTMLGAFPLTILYIIAGSYIHNLHSIYDVTTYATIFGGILAFLYLIIFLIKRYF